MRRSSALSTAVPDSSSRTSCSVIACRLCRGSPPTSVTTMLTDLESSHTTGRASVAIRSRIGAANKDSGIARCSPSRFGASSPNTRLTKVMHAVTTANASVDATPPDSPCRSSQDRSSPTSVSAPKAPVTSVASVTPICTADRNRFGSVASRAARAPRLPRLASDRT